MGGIGSGRSYFSAKETTQDYISIDIRRWNRDGLLAPNKSFGWQWSRNGRASASIWVHTEPDRVILSYKHQRGGDPWRSESYPVYLDWTSCNLGGKRPWFLCPASGCGRRVAILYGGGIFACRHCYQLAYPSQREPAYDRAAGRADRIREKLGWPRGFLNGNGGKPKGMHWKTYWKLVGKHDKFVQESLVGIANHLNIQSESPGDWI